MPTFRSRRSGIDLRTLFKPSEPMTDVEYLRDLSHRVLKIPVMHGTDHYDVSRLLDIARRLEKKPKPKQKQAT
jgi:hypothetical protein